jgi:hypothetical protein
MRVCKFIWEFTLGKNPLAVPSAQKYFPWQPIYVDIWWFIQGKSLFAVLSVLSHLLWKLICKFIREFTLEKNPLAVPSAQKYFLWQPIYVDIWWFIQGRFLFAVLNDQKYFPRQLIYADIWWFILGRPLFLVRSVLSYLLWKLVCKFESSLRRKNLWLSWFIRCPKCSKVFSQATNLRRHMMVHTGKTPFFVVRSVLIYLPWKLICKFFSEGIWGEKLFFLFLVS